MDSLDYAYLKEETKILLPCPLTLSTEHDNFTAFYALSEDLDKINLIRVREGKVKVAKLKEIPEETLKNLLLDGFGADAWKYADIELPFKAYHGQLSLQKQHINTHTTHTGLAATADQVLARVRHTKQQALIVSTLDDQWETGLLYSLIQQIKQGLNFHYLIISF